MHVPDSECSNVTGLPGVRFSSWLSFKNRFKHEELEGVAVEALVGPPDLRVEISIDEERRTLANAIGPNMVFASALPNFGSQHAHSTDAILHRVRIWSPAVRKRLSSLIGSGTNLETLPVTFLRPFRELIFYHDKMKMELEDATDTAAQSPSCQDEFKDLANYVNFVDQTILPLKARWNSGYPIVPGKIRHVDLPYIYVPGELCYLSDKRNVTDETCGGSRVVTVVSLESYAFESDFTDKAVSQMSSTWKRGLHITFVRLDYDGRDVRPVMHRQQMNAYEGEKDIRSLPLWPLRFEPDAAKILSEYQRSGRKFTSFCARRRHLLHNGWTLGWTPPPRSTSTAERHDAIPSELVESEVIVDFPEALRSVAKWNPNFSQRISGDEVATPSCAIDSWPILTWTDESSTTPLARISELVILDSGLQIEDQKHAVSRMPLLGNGTAQEKELEEDHFALLPPRVFAYSLRDRKFVLAHVDSLSEVKNVEGGFKNLSIPEPRLQMIGSLVGDHFNTKRFEEVEGFELTGQDFIHGKGRGTAIILHGDPGVGKTATAEAVAKEYAKPLFPMSCEDLGTTPETVRRNLRHILRLADLWGCVLILDEADVFLSRREQRSIDPLSNALVSVFLQELEFNSGLLFLTTNCPGPLNNAVVARVDASFFYHRLDWIQTQGIFEVNMKRLRRTEDQRAKYEQKALDTQGRWNGHQIHKLFRIAASLARRAADELGEKHFQQAAHSVNDYIHATEHLCAPRKA